MISSRLFPPAADGLSATLRKGDVKLSPILKCRGRFSTRASVVRMGEKNGRLYFLRSGWAARLRYLPEGQAQYSAILLPGDLIGAETLVFERQTEEVVALTPCELDFADYPSVWASINNDPEIAARLMWNMCENSRRLGNWLVAIGRGDAEQRVALLLLEIRARLIIAGEIDGERSTIPFPLTQQVIADLLGLTAVHVNRTLKKLREDGHAWVKGAQAVLDVNALARIAAPLLDVHEKSAPEFGLAGSLASA
jgi:CRP/FNR family transcriptional regulator, anaerobic regulatory protein